MLQYHTILHRWRSFSLSVPFPHMAHLALALAAMAREREAGENGAELLACSRGNEDKAIISASSELDEDQFCRKMRGAEGQGRSRSRAMSPS